MCSSTSGLGWGLNSSGITKGARAKVVYRFVICLGHPSLQAQLGGNAGDTLLLQEGCFALLLRIGPTRDKLQKRLLLYSNSDSPCVSKVLT